MAVSCGAQCSPRCLHLFIAGFDTPNVNHDSLEGRQVPHAHIEVATGDPSSREAESKEFQHRCSSPWKHRRRRRDAEEVALRGARERASGNDGHDLFVMPF